MIIRETLRLYFSTLSLVHTQKMGNTHAIQIYLIKINRDEQEHMSIFKCDKSCKMHNIKVDMSYITKKLR